MSLVQGGGGGGARGLRFSWRSPQKPWAWGEALWRGPGAQSRLGVRVQSLRIFMVLSVIFLICNKKQGKNKF